MSKEMSRRKTTTNILFYFVTTPDSFIFIPPVKTLKNNHLTTVRLTLCSTVNRSSFFVSNAI